MKKLLIALLLGGVAHAADDALWVKQELSMLKEAYKNYTSAPAPRRPALEGKLSECAPAVKQFTLPNGELRSIPFLSFFSMVDPITGESTASSDEKLGAALRDYGSVEAFTAMTALLEGYYNDKNDEKLFLDTQKLMLGWAQLAANPKTPQIERKKLSSAFSFMVSELGHIPVLLRKAPAYRTRRAFTLETPEAATEEAQRIQELIKEASALK